MNDYYDYYTYSSPPTFNPLPTIISLVLCVFVLVCMWIVFRKARLGSHCSLLQSLCAV